MIQSLPSSTALATSLASARVGRGFLVMLSSILMGTKRQTASFHVCRKALIWTPLIRAPITDLCGTDDWLANPVAFAGHHFLGDEDLLGWDFNSQISTGHHDAITSFQDLIKSFRKKKKGGGMKKKSSTIKKTDLCCDHLHTTPPTCARPHGSPAC